MGLTFDKGRSGLIPSEACYEYVYGSYKGSF